MKRSYRCSIGINNNENDLPALGVLLIIAAIRCINKTASAGHPSTLFNLGLNPEQY